MVTELVAYAQCLDCEAKWDGAGSDSESAKHTKGTKHTTVSGAIPKGTTRVSYQRPGHDDRDDPRPEQRPV